jgi:hypothetical protein
LSGISGTVIGNNARATKEPGEPNHAGNAGGKSLWWSYQPSSDGLLSLSTADSTFNTLLALYSGATNQMAALQLVAANDDASPGSGFSKITQSLRGGQRYFIAVDGYKGSTGTVNLAYSFSSSRLYNLKIDVAQGGSVSPTTGDYQEGTSVLLTATPDPFFWFDSWDGTVHSTENPLPLVMKGNVELVPRFRPIEFSDGFETGNLSKLAWQTSTNMPWSIQTNVVQAGLFAAKSGAIGNGQKTSLTLKGVCRAGSASFGVKVSSEPTWDVLDFYLNGRAINRWSGEVGWTTYEFSVPAGTNTFEWRYSKDFLNTKAGLDSAFIDNLNLPLFVSTDSSSPAHLALHVFDDGNAQLEVLGQTNQLYVIQSSSDLNSWQSVSTNTARGGLLRLSSPVRMGGSNLFYRALVP